MWTLIDWGISAQLFLLATTVLFMLLTIMLLNRSRHLRRKVSDMLETLASKDKELSKARAEAQNLLSPFIPETSRSVIISMDPSGKIIETNDYAAELFGFQKEDLIGKKALGLIFPEGSEDTPPHSNIITRILANPKLYVEHETENIKKSGEHLWISWTNRVMYDDSGKPTELRSVGFDITKRKRLEEELKYLASVDPQTGVLNRQALLEAGMHEIKRAHRYKRELSVLIMRLDYFHDTTVQRDFSDDIIRKMIALTQGTIRDSDYIGRVGDIEFAILLPETSKEDAMCVADRIKSKIEDESLKKTDGFFITIHFGVAEKEGNKDTIDDMLLRALESFQQQAKKRKNLIKQKKKKE
ncbi:MAG: sensor domain-containing diguanylate cyclase [Pseudomonadota bacterium]|nr:sensor domain-containing diguanylate cyclase [Pseudomonadota bacterium]